MHQGVRLRARGHDSLFYITVATESDSICPSSFCTKGKTVVVLACDMICVIHEEVVDTSGKETEAKGGNL